MINFGKIELEEVMMEALKAQKINKPTAVQEAVYEEILAGKNMIVQAQTGSGKTLAYLLPLIRKYQGIEKSNKVLILVPTQELALQVHRQIEQLAKNTGSKISSVAVFGNVRIDRQIESLREKPLFVVGTANRVLELIEKKKIAAHLIETLVLDEADKLLHKKVIEEQKMVCKKLMRDTQKLFFSASMPEAAVKAAEELAPQAVIYREKKENTMPTTIQHSYAVVKKNERIEMLRKVLSAHKNQKCIVFINGSYEIEQALAKLTYLHYNVEAIYGRSSKEERKNAMERFKSGKTNILIATDIAARGLHIEGIDVVIHVALPQDKEDYQHRAGRCGRNGKKGESIVFVTENELPHIQKLERQLLIHFAHQTTDNKPKTYNRPKKKAADPKKK